MGIWTIGHELARDVFVALLPVSIWGDTWFRAKVRHEP